MPRTFSFVHDQNKLSRNLAAHHAVLGTQTRIRKCVDPRVQCLPSTCVTNFTPFIRIAHAAILFPRLVRLEARLKRSANMKDTCLRPEGFVRPSQKCSPRALWCARTSQRTRNKSMGLQVQISRLKQSDMFVAASTTDALRSCFWRARKMDPTASLASFVGR